jgi:hypothetical protein
MSKQSGRIGPAFAVAIQVPDGLRCGPVALAVNAFPRVGFVNDVRVARIQGRLCTPSLSCLIL